MCASNTHQRRKSLVVFVLAMAAMVIVGGLSPTAAALPRANGKLSATFHAGADSYVDSCAASSNYSTADVMYVQNDSTEFICDAWSLLDFDLGTFPKGAIFRSATLRLYQHSFYAGSGSRTIAIYPASASWDAGTVNWKTRPGVLSVVAYGTVGTSTGWREYDISTVVQRWLVTGVPNHGLVIKPNTSGSWMRSYRTRNYGTGMPYQPQLVVSYDMPTRTPTRTATRTRTRTPTATRTQTKTRTSTATATRTQTKTRTSTATATQTQTKTRTFTPTTTRTHTKTHTSTPTVTASPSSSPSSTATSTPTQTATATVPATNTATHAPTATQMAVTPTATATATPPTTRVTHLLPAVADSYVNEATIGWNYGTDFTLLAGTGPEPGEFRQLTRSFLRFDQTPLPADATVESAVLHIYARDLYAAGGQGTVELSLHRVYAPWEESGKFVGINWDNQPDVAFLSSHIIDTDVGWKLLDVTEIMRSWVRGTLPNYGLMIGSDQSGALFECEFVSRESTRCTPYIEVTYTTDEIPPESPPPPWCGPRTDTTPPSLTLSADPDPGTAGSPVEVTAVAQDAGGVYRVRLLRGIWRAGEETRVGGQASLEVSETFTLEPGMHAFSVWAWDMEMNPAVTSILLRVYHDGQPPRVTVEHEPRSPLVGEVVTFRAHAEDESLVNHITIFVNGRAFDRHFDPPERSPEFTVRYDRETIGFDPSGIRVLRYRASATDGEGLFASTGTKYALFGNTGTDADGDHLSDEIEEILGIDPDNNDTDRDGLYDHWEVLGFDADGDGDADVDLPGMGATPYQKDVFVEMDWVQDGDVSYLYHPLGIQGVVNAFLDYSLHLHVDTGQFGGGNSLPYDTNADDAWYYETKLENFALERYGIFYYAAISPAPDRDRYGGKYMSGGHVFLRRTVPRNATPAKDAVYLFHELGHGMELGHGGQRSALGRRYSTLGPDGILEDVAVDWTWDDDNNKINYLSNMNYRYQTYLKVRADSGDDVYIYRYYTLPDSILDETNLDEDLGWVAEARLGTYVWRSESPADPSDPGEWVLLREGLGGWYYVRPGYKECSAWWLANGTWIDWNRNGLHDEDPYSWDVNPNDCAVPTEIGEQHARNELASLRPKIYGDIYRDSASAAFAAADPAEPHEDGDVELATDGEYCDGVDNDGDGLIDEGFADADGDGIPDPIDNCVLTHNPDQLDAGRNWIGDACESLPPAPTDFSVGVIGGAPTLAWTPSQAPDLIGYNVYRKRSGENDFRRLGGSYPTVLAAVFEDDECVAGADYAVTAVDLYMKESEPAAGLLNNCGCEGDCDDSSSVTVDELVKGVNIALGTLALSECIAFDPSGDQRVTVDELVQAVNNALNGCS